MKSFFSAWLFMGIIVFGYGSTSKATESQAKFNQFKYLSGKDVLKGLKGVSISVPSKLDDVLENSGLTSNKIRTEVELRLRKAGIEIRQMPKFKDNNSVTDQERATLFDFAESILFVDVSTTKLKIPGAYLYRVQITLTETVIPSRNRSVYLGADTWKTGASGTTTESQLVDLIRGQVGDSVDEFINLYLEANPKK